MGASHIGGSSDASKRMLSPHGVPTTLRLHRVQWARSARGSAHLKHRTVAATQNGYAWPQNDGHVSVPWETGPRTAKVCVLLQVRQRSAELAAQSQSVDIVAAMQLYVPASTAQNMFYNQIHQVVLHGL